MGNEVEGHDGKVRVGLIVRESVTIDKTLSLTIEKTAKPRPPPSLSLTPPPSLSPTPPPSLTDAFANTASFVFEICTSEGRGFVGRVVLDLVSREVTGLVRRERSRV